MISKERLQDTFINIVKVDSTPKHEMANWLVKHLEARGIESKIDNGASKFDGNSGNVIAYIKGSLDIEPICFQAHMDQVVPCIGVKPVVEGNIIKTDGTISLSADDKAGIDTILEALLHRKLLQKNISK